MPPPLTSLYDETMPAATFIQLVRVSFQIMYPCLCLQLKRKPRCKLRLELWFQRRAGRNEAFRLKPVARAVIPSVIIISRERDMLQQSHKFSSKATAWGFNHGEAARQAFQKSAVIQHKSFQLSVIGLVSRTNYP